MTVRTSTNRSALGDRSRERAGQVTPAVLLGGLSFRAASGAPVTPEPRMTLRPGAPVTMLVAGPRERG